MYFRRWFFHAGNGFLLLFLPAITTYIIAQLFDINSKWGLGLLYLFTVSPILFTMLYVCRTYVRRYFILVSNLAAILILLPSSTIATLLFYNAIGRNFHTEVGFWMSQWQLLQDAGPIIAILLCTSTGLYCLHRK